LSPAQNLIERAQLDFVQVTTILVFISWFQVW